MASIRLSRSKKAASTSTRGPRLPPLRDDRFEVADDATGSTACWVDELARTASFVLPFPSLVDPAAAFDLAAAALFFGLITPL